LKSGIPFSILAAFPAPRISGRGPIKEDVMRKFLVLALVPMFFAATACNKSEETPAPEASASAPASEEASPAASMAAPESPAAPAPSDAGSPAASPAAS
jgi:hypothetical protein